MNKKFKPFLEYASEGTAACLLTMVQGNVLILTLHHLAIASQTRLIAGAIAALTIPLAKIARPAAVSVALGVVTTVVDFFVHPGMFGSVVMEALVTGVVAGLLSYVVGRGVRAYRASQPEAGRS